MLKKITFRNALLVFNAVILILSVIIALLTRNSFLYSSKDIEKISNAKLSINTEFLPEINSMYTAVTYDTALAELDKAENIFYVKCISSELCYNCMKYKLEVKQTIKGNESENSNIVLYQFVSFEFVGDEIYFSLNDRQLPLKENNEYIIFASKRNYDNAYIKTLECNEYSLNLPGEFTTAIPVNVTQKKYIDISKAKIYSDVKDLYYICFDKKSLNNINNISTKITRHYIY